MTLLIWNLEPFKTVKMKKTFTIILAIFTAGLLAQTVSTDFESTAGNRGAETCWGFGGFGLTTRDAIAGYSARSGSLNDNENSFWIKSPFINLESGNLQFDFKLHNSDNSSRTYRVYVDFISFDAADPWGEGAIVNGGTYELSHPFDNTQAVSIAVPPSLANDGNAYKVYFRFRSVGGNRNRRAVVDNFSIPGTFASDPANNCLPLVSSPDSDFDGVADDVDEFPNDPTRVFGVQLTGDANNYHTFAFEDLWPSKGDYDFNDLILDFNVTTFFNANNRISRIDGTWMVRAKGGGLIQGFGVHFPTAQSSQVQSISGQQLSTGTINLNGNGTEANQSGLVIIFCDDVETMINRAGGSFFNTVSSNPQGSSSPLNFSVVFSQPLTMEQFDAVSIFAFKERDEEIHRVDNIPTDLADPSLFGTGDDDSDPASGRYYRTQQGFPWMIEVSEQFAYPEEKVDIVQAYLNFANWAQSNGEASEDWYTGASGNRVNSNIYGN